MSIDVKSIRRKLDELRSAPIQASDACGKIHRYLLNPPLAEREATAFEAKHAIALPSDYRLFLTELGNGGVGPSYGIFKLGEMDDGWDQAPWEKFPGFVGVLSVPFPHRGPWNLMLGPPGADESEADYERRMAEWEQQYYFGAVMSGAMPISHRGCALRTWLVLTGDEAGHIWYDDRADAAGIYPAEQNGRERSTFAEWYIAWLDSKLSSQRGSASM